MRRDEHGYIVVETVGAFIPFVLLMVAILSLINIVAVQTRVHYALTQAANTFSMYSYSLEVLGVANDLTTLSNKAERVSSEAGKMRDDINAVLSGVESFSRLFSSSDNIGNIADRAYGWGEDIVGDPKGTLQLIMNFTIDELRNKVFEEMARPLIGRYLANGGMTGNEYLLRAGVVNGDTGKKGLEALEFFRLENLGRGDSVLIDANGNVKLTVEYGIEAMLAGMHMPFRPTLHITQTVITKAWLNGSGKGYK